MLCLQCLVNCRPFQPKRKLLNLLVPNHQSDQFNTINVADLVDWIPIENNKEDFDLGQILQEVESNATATRPPPPLQVAVPQEKDPVTTTQNTVVHNITTNRECSISLSSQKCTSQTPMLQSTIISTNK